MKTKNQINQIITSLLMVLITTLITQAQTTQTIRGRVVDEVSKTPLIGVNITIIGTDPILGNATDLDGNFRIEQVPVGSIKIHCLQPWYYSRSAKPSSQTHERGVD